MQGCMRKTSFDTCLDVLIMVGGHARKPLRPLFEEHEILQNSKITFIFGESDFFKREHADQLI